MWQVKLMKQVKEESERSKQCEARRTREVGQMKREQLKKESLIKTLEREKYQKELILRRKQEEVDRVVFGCVCVCAVSYTHLTLPTKVNV